MFPMFVPVIIACDGFCVGDAFLFVLTVALDEVRMLIAVHQFALLVRGSTPTSNWTTYT